MAQNVALKRQNRARLLLLVAAGAIAATYAQIGLPTSALAALSSEPTLILLSGTLLVGLGGALRRCDF